jgi:uncharacterized damage-inducible protein DinB
MPDVGWLEYCPVMTVSDPKSDLRDYLQGGRDTLLWKLEGLSEYDARRPLTPTGTNLLGLVKHLATWEFRYFGEVFGRPPADLPPWSGDTGMWATAGETRKYIAGWYRRAWAHADATFDALDLDAVGQVPWWGGSEVTLHQIMLHMVVDTQRHAGHADIVRELVDGATGLLPGNDNMSPRDQAGWADHRNQVEQAARAAGR